MDLGEIARRTATPTVAAPLDDQEQVLALTDLAEQAVLAALVEGTRLDDVGHDVDTIVAGPVGEGPAQRGDLHLLRGPLGVVTRDGAVHDATAGELRHTGRTLTGAAGALLAVRLLATTTDLATGLDLCVP